MILACARSEFVQVVKNRRTACALHAMTRACDVSSCPRPQHARTPSDRVPTPQAPDAVQLSPDAQPKTAQLPQHHNSYVFVRSWIAQHAGPCAESHSSTPSHTPLNNHRSVSHPLPAATTENFHQPYAQALHSRLDHALSADVDGLSDAFPHNPLPPPSACSANSAHGEPSSQCSINSMHSYPSYQYLKSKAHQSAYCQRAAPPHSHSPSLPHAHTVAAPTGPGYPSSFFFPVHPTAKQSGPRNHPRTRSYSGSPFSQNGMHHVQSNSNAASWRSGGQAQPPPVPPPPHGRPVVHYEARHLSSPPCLPQPPPPALPEGYSAPPRHSGRQRTIHYSHPNHQSHSSHDHIPGPPPLPEAMAVSSWGHRPPPPRSWQPSARVVPPPPPPVASAGLPSTSQPGSLLASPQPDPLAAPVREAAAAPVSQPSPQTPPHERPHSDLERFLQAVDRLWAAPPPPPPAADSTSAPSCSHDHLDGGAGHCCQPASDPASPSDRGCCHRPCNPMGNSNGSEGNDTLDSGLPEGSGSRQPAPATLADVWSRVEDCSAFGLEVTCAAKGSVSCSYFVPHLSALHIVATAPQDDAPGALDTLFDDGESTAPPEALRGGRMNEEGTDEAATDGTAEESGADAHTHSGDADTVPSPVAGGMDMDTSGFLHSGAPSTSRGSVMHVCPLACRPLRALTSACRIWFPWAMMQLVQGLAPQCTCACVAGVHCSLVACVAVCKRRHACKLSRTNLVFSFSLVFLQFAFACRMHAITRTPAIQNDAPCAPI